MKSYNILDVLPSPLSNQFDFVASYDDDTFTIFDTEYFVTCLYQHFASFCCILSETDTAACFVELFRIWKVSRNDNYARRAYALQVEYSPLENYDRIEEETTSGTTSHGHTVNTTHGGSLTTKNTGDEKTSNAIYGVNSSAASPSDTSTTDYNTTETITDSRTTNETNGGTDRTSGERSGRVHGNVGVTTSQQMLESDIALIRHDLALTAVSDFVHRFCYYAEPLE